MDILKAQNQQNKTYAIHEKKTYISHDWWVRKGPCISSERVGNKATAYVDGEESLEAMAEAIKNANNYIYITDWGMTATVRLVRKNNGPNGPQVKKITSGTEISLRAIALKNHTSVSEIIRLNPNLIVWKKLENSFKNDLEDAMLGAGGTYIKYRTEEKEVLASTLGNVETLANYYLPKHSKNVPILVPSDKEETLVNLLADKANNGIDVRIILWECSSFAPTDVDATDKILSAASPKIRVSRHTPGVKPIAGSLDGFLFTHHQKSMVVDGKIAFVGGVDLYTGRWDNKHHHIYADPKIWGGDLYTSTIDADSSDPRYVASPRNDRDHRLPWHDVHCRIEGPSVYDVEKNFFERWNFQCKENDRNDYLKAILCEKPKFDKGANKGDRKQKVQILRSASPGMHVLESDVPSTEHSINTAYLNAIKNAQHFVYIENQFFVSNYGVDNAASLIGQTIADRVIKAIENTENFKVIIVIPAHPEGSEYAYPTQGTMYFTRLTIGGKLNKAEIEEKESPNKNIKLDVERAVVTSSTIARYLIGDSVKKDRDKSYFDESMLNRIVAKIMAIKGLKAYEAWEDVFNYVGIYNLHNCGVVGGKLAHSQIYVHAKTMIVDDRIAIIGSANLNERSQLGFRDSEIAALIEDTDKIKNTVGPLHNKEQAHEHWVRKFAHDLRIRLWSEHLGFEKETDINTIKNPIKGFDVIKDKAKKNTKLYEDTFADMPRDSVTTIEEQKQNVLKQRENDECWNPDAVYKDIKGKLCGHIVKYPLYWLWDTVRVSPFSYQDNSIDVFG